MLSGRLGLEKSRIPHSDRHGLLWLERGNLKVVDGCLHFVAAGSEKLQAGDYSIPYQNISIILLGPGSTISHDTLRLLARHGTALVAVGENGVRHYTSAPLGTNDSTLARKQAVLWANYEMRIDVARKMYALRLGEVLPYKSIEKLRGIEGIHVRESYKLLAHKFGIEWRGRKYDRTNPNNTDTPNLAINHTATAVEAAAMIAVSATGTLPQLGFVHEASTNAFTLDIADLYRHDVTVTAAFEATAIYNKTPEIGIERLSRQTVGKMIQSKKLIPQMIDRIKNLINQEINNDGGSNND